MLADFVAIQAWHKDIREHYVGDNLLQLFNGLLAVAHSNDLHPFIGESKINHLLDCGGIVCEQQLASRYQNWTPSFEVSAISGTCSSFMNGAGRVWRGSRQLWCHGRS